MIIVSASEAADFIVYIRGWSEARAACRTPPFLGRGLVVLGVLAAVHGWTLCFGPSVGELPETQTECVATTSHFATATATALFVFRATRDTSSRGTNMTMSRGKKVHPRTEGARGPRDQPDVAEKTLFDICDSWPFAKAQLPGAPSRQGLVSRSYVLVLGGEGGE